MIRLIRLFVLGVWLGGFSPVFTFAHLLTVTQVIVSFNGTQTIDVRIDIDLTALLPSPERYYELSAAPADLQQQMIDELLPLIREGFQLYVGEERLKLSFQGYTLPSLTRLNFLDPSVDHFTTLRFGAAWPASRQPLRLLVPDGSRIQFPVVFVVQIPSNGIAASCWMEDGMDESDPFNWAGAVLGRAAAGQPGAAGCALRDQRRDQGDL